MIPEEYKKIMVSIHEKTINKKAFWKETIESDKYILSLSKFSITIYEKLVGIEYRIVIINENGDEIDRFSVKYTDSGLDDVRETYDYAKRIALKIDEAIKQIEEDVTQSDTIGLDD